MDLFPVVSFPWKLVLDKLEMGNKWEELGIFLLQQNLTKTQFTTIPVTPFLFWIPTLYNWINCFSKYKLFPISKIQDTKKFWFLVALKPKWLMFDISNSISGSQCWHMMNILYFLSSVSVHPWPSMLTDKSIFTSRSIFCHDKKIIIINVFCMNLWKTSL